MQPLIEYNTTTGNVIERIPLQLASPSKVTKALAQAGHNTAHKLVVEAVANAIFHGEAAQVLLALDREVRRMEIQEIEGRGMASEEIVGRFWRMFEELDRENSLGPKWDAGIKQALRLMEYVVVTTRTYNERYGRRYVIDFHSENFDLLLVDDVVECLLGTTISAVMRLSDPFPSMDDVGVWLASVIREDLLSKVTIESVEDGKTIRKNAVLFLPKQGSGKTFVLSRGLHGVVYFEPSIEGRLRVISRGLVYEMPLSSILRETQVGAKSVDLLDPDGILFECVPLEKHSGQGFRDVEPWFSMKNDLKIEVLKLDAQRKEEQQKREKEAFDKQLQELERRALKAFEALDITELVALIGRGRLQKKEQEKREKGKRKGSKSLPKDRRRGALINFGRDPDQAMLGWAVPIDTRNPDGPVALWFNENFLPYEKLRQGKKESSVRTRQARLVYVAQFLAQIAAQYKLKKENLADSGENRVRIMNKFQKEFAVDFGYDEEGEST